MTGRPVKRARAAGFTLVEMLVVIVIIGILASLTTVAVIAALDKAHQTQIQVELNQISAAFERYKNEYGSYPPNFFPSNLHGGGLSNAQQDAIRAAITRHLRKAFPRSIDSITDIVDLTLTADEAVVFWLAGFSSDPEHPFTGVGGPASPIDERTNALMEFDVSRLGPRDPNDVLDPRILPISTRTSTGTTVEVDVYIYIYRPPKVDEPYVYFDTSRIDADPNTADPGRYELDYRGYEQPSQADPKQWSNGVPQPLVQSSSASGKLQYVNPKSFQVLAAGTDDEWDERSPEGGWDPDLAGWPTFPDGPFLGPRADNLCNFSTTRLEDSQP